MVLSEIHVNDLFYKLETYMHILCRCFKARCIKENVGSFVCSLFFYISILKNAVHLRHEASKEIKVGGTVPQNNFTGTFASRLAKVFYTGHLRIVMNILS